MTLEHFPVGEKLATNLDSQVAWLAIEMGYSRDKPIDYSTGASKGYLAKLERLQKEPSANDSVLGFMGSYWKRFRIAEEGLEEFELQEMANRALQAHAKVVAGLSDKIAFSMWLASQQHEATHDQGELIEEALDLVKKRVAELKEEYTDEQLQEFNSTDTFTDNPMGQAILGLHKAYESNPADTETMKFITLDGAAVGVLMWKAFARELVKHNYSVEMPMPGVGSGNIEPWE
jgi:hypothetical protein